MPPPPPLALAPPLALLPPLFAAPATLVAPLVLVLPPVLVPAPPVAPLPPAPAGSFSEEPQEIASNTSAPATALEPKFRKIIICPFFLEALRAGVRQGRAA